MDNTDFQARFAVRRQPHPEFTKVADELIRKFESAWPGLIGRSFHGGDPTVFIPAFGSGVDPSDFGGITGYSTVFGLGDGYLDFILFDGNKAMKVTIDPNEQIDYFWLGSS